MSESPFPIEGNDESAYETDPEESGSRVRLLGLVALAGVAVAAGGFFLLGGSSDTEEVAFVPAARSPQQAAPAAPVPPVAVIPAAADVKIGTNPFLALVKEPIEAAPAEPGSPGAPGSPSTAGSGISIPGSTTPAPGSMSANGFVGQLPTGTLAALPGSAGTTPIVVISAPAPVAPTPAPTATPAPVPAPSTLELVDVVETTGAPVARFAMNGKEFEGAPGQVLGGKVLIKELVRDAAGDWVATVQVGDGRPFKLYKGSEVVIPS